MLRYYFMPRLRNYSNNIIFYQDVAFSQLSTVVRNYLDYKLPGRRMGRDCPIAWPAYSPDLTSCDYLLRCYIKYRVQRTPQQHQYSLVLLPCEKHERDSVSKKQVLVSSSLLKL